MKKRTLFAALALGIFLLSGCTKQPQEGTKPKNTELAALQTDIAEQNAMLGMGFFGYIDSQSDEAAVRVCVADSALAEGYPFLKDCDPILAEGAELYALVPVNGNTAITVCRSEISEDGNYIDHKDAPLYAGKPGEVVILRCNLSEICANVLVMATDGANSLAFHPMISLENGRINREKGCYDFSAYEEDPVRTARDQLLATDQVRHALEQEKMLLSTGSSQTIQGRTCLLFALGTDHENQFVREQLYAVGGDFIYVFDAQKAQWQMLEAK